MRRVLFAFVICTLLASCGYHLPGQGGVLAQGGAVYLPLFENRSSEPLLEQLAASCLSEELSRNSRVRLVERSDVSDMVLRGSVSRYVRSALAYDSADNIALYRLTIALHAELMNVADKQIVWQGDLIRSENFYADSNKMLQDDREENAKKVLMQRLVEDLYDQLVDDF